jgi:tetratricopeptide (TPR) repeat protein
MATQRHTIRPRGASRRLIKVLPSVVAYSVLLAACADVDPEASFALAEARFDEHNYREAAIHARNVLQADDAHVQARIVLGRSSLALADFQDAEFHLSRAASLGAPQRDYVVPLAEANLQLGNTSAALEVLERLPDNERGAEYWVTRSSALLREGDVDGAKEALDQTESRSVSALLARAQIALALQDARVAEALVREAVEQDSSDPSAWTMFANIVFAVGRPEEAEEALDRAAELYRARGQYAYAAPALLQLVQVQLAQSKLDSAAASVERLSARFPGSVEAHVAAGALALQRGEIDQALDALRQASARVENHPEVEMMLGAANLLAGNLGQAEQRLQAALAAGSANPVVVRLLAETRLRLGRPGPALEALSRLNASIIGQDPALSMFAGLAHLESGNAANAVPFLERAVELAPANPGAVLQLARAYNEAGRPQDAARLMQSSSAVVSEDGFGAKVALLLQTLREQGEGAARTFVDELLAERPNDPENRVVAATLAYTLGDRATARAHLDVALASDADSVSALLLTASLDAEDGQYANAESKLTRVLALQPRNEAAPLALARLRLKMADEEGARSVLRQAVAAADEASPRLMVPLAELELRLGAPDQARAIAAELQRRSPPMPEGYLLAGAIEREAGRHAEAATAFRAAYDLQPSPENLQNAVAAYRAAGSGEWESLLTGRLQAQSGDLIARLLLADSLQAAGRTGEALAAYEAVLARDATNIMALNNAAWVAYDRDNEKSVRYAQRAAELAPDNAAVLDTFGWILVRESRHDEALPYLERAVQLSSGAPEIRYHLAVAQARAGRREAARQALEALLADSPQFESRNEAQAFLDSL